jgi:uncharacterized repeat protein (TIGR03803 family)
MSASTERSLVAECSGRPGVDQLNGSHGSSRGWLPPSVGRASAALAALFLLLAGAGQQAHAQTFTVIHNFAFTDGANPFAGLIMDSSGNLYGTAQDGGSDFAGTVFKIDPSGAATVLHDFNYSLDGGYPAAGLIMDSQGNVYGTTSFGGSNGTGTVFKIDPSGTEFVLLTLNSTYGIFPFAGLIMDSQGNLYGTTSSGGLNSCSCGTVFKIDSSGTPTVFHNFIGTDGKYPLAGLIMDSSGNLYGTATNGGSNGAGTVFKIDPSGATTVLHSFNPSTDGGYPEAGLIMDSSGNLYGTTTARGSVANGGTVFKIDPSGNLTVLHIFGGSDGLQPYAGLIMDSSSNLYGTTAYGGSNGAGTVFKIDPSGTETVLHSFNSSIDGGYPYAGLVMDPLGNLYGTTAFGGANFDGTVFEITTTVPFAYFSVKLNTTSGSPRTIEMKAPFTLGDGAAAIDPVAQGMTLTVGTYTLTIPPGAFRMTNGRMWIYQGTINGVTIEAHIQQTGTNSYQLQLVASGVDLTSLANPVPVTLTIGNNDGTTQVNR